MTGGLCMELRHLRYFVAVAQEEHITRAAARLGIQQPPLSQQIKVLEENLGVDLFDRQPRKIRLNATGKVFLSDARRILASFEEAVERVRNFNLGQEGNLLIGLTSSASMHPITIAIIEEFRAQHPLISLQIEEGANHDLLTLLEEERLDFAFVRSDVERYPTVERHTLSHEGMVVAIPARHPLAAEEGVPLRLEELADLDFVIFRQVNGSGIHEALMAACKNAGFAPKVVNTTERVMSAINMVAASFGVAVVPAAIQSFRLPNVVYRPVSDNNDLTVPLNLAYLRSTSNEAKRKFKMTCDEINERDDGSAA